MTQWPETTEQMAGRIVASLAAATNQEGTLERLRPVAEIMDRVLSGRMQNADRMAALLVLGAVVVDDLVEHLKRFGEEMPGEAIGHHEFLIEVATAMLANAAARAKADLN